MPGSQAEGLRRLQAYISMEDVDFWLFQELIGSPRGETMRCLVALLVRRNVCVTFGQLPNMRRRRVETLRSE